MRSLLLAFAVMAIMSTLVITSSVIFAQESSPKAITGVTTESSVAGSLTISWNAPSQAPTDYRVAWYKDGEDFPSWKDANVPGVKGNNYPVTPTLSLTGLDGKSSYTIRVRARYAGDSHGPWSDTVSATPSGVTERPPRQSPSVTATATPNYVPTNVKIAPGDGGRMTVFWDAGDTNNIPDKFVVNYRSGGYSYGVGTFVSESNETNPDGIRESCCDNGKVRAGFKIVSATDAESDSDFGYELEIPGTASRSIRPDNVFIFKVYGVKGNGTNSSHYHGSSNVSITSGKNHNLTWSDSDRYAATIELEWNGSNQINNVILLYKSGTHDYPTVPASLTPASGDTSAGGKNVAGYRVLAGSATSHSFTGSDNMALDSAYEFTLRPYDTDTSIVMLDSAERTVGHRKSPTSTIHGTPVSSGCLGEITEINKTSPSSAPIQFQSDISFTADSTPARYLFKARSDCFSAAAPYKDDGADWITNMAATHRGSRSLDVDFSVAAFIGSDSTRSGEKRYADVWAYSWNNQLFQGSNTPRVTVIQSYSLVNSCIPDDGVAVSASDGTTNLLTGSDGLDLSVGSAGASYKLNFDFVSSCNTSGLEMKTDPDVIRVTAGSYGAASVTGYDKSLVFTVAPYTGQDPTKHNTSRTVDVWIFQTNTADNTADDGVYTKKVSITQPYDFDPPITVECDPVNCTFYPSATPNEISQGFSRSLRIKHSYDATHFSGNVSSDITHNAGSHIGAQVPENADPSGFRSVTVAGNGSFEIKYEVWDDEDQTDRTSVSTTVTATTVPPGVADCTIWMHPVLLNVVRGAGSGYLDVNIPSDSTCKDTSDRDVAFADKPQLRDSFDPAEHIVVDSDWVTNLRKGTHSKCSSNATCVLYDVTANPGPARTAEFDIYIGFDRQLNLVSDTVSVRQMAVLPVCTAKSFASVSSSDVAYIVGDSYRGEGMTGTWKYFSTDEEGEGCASTGMYLPGAGLYHICGSNDPDDCGTGRGSVWESSGNRTAPKAIKENVDGTDTTVAEWVAVRVKDSTDSGCTSPSLIVKEDDRWISLHFGCSDDSALLRDDDFASWGLTAATATETHADVSLSPWKTPTTKWGVWELTCPDAGVAGGVTISGSVTYNGTAYTATKTGVCSP